MTPDAISAIATVISDLLIAFSILFAARQWREAAQQTKKAAVAISAATYQGVNAQLQEIDLLFVQYPELRPYFYADKPMPQDRRERDRVMAVAELLVDFMDNVVTQGHAMPADHRKVWNDYFKEQHASSAAIRIYWHENSHWYRKELLDILGPPTADRMAS